MEASDALRESLRRAAALVAGLREGSGDEQALAALKSEVAAAYAEAQALRPAPPREALRALRIADGILQYLGDLGQKDARGRLRDVEGALREALAA